MKPRTHALIWTGIGTVWLGIAAITGSSDAYLVSGLCLAFGVSWAILS
jgi:hypothetical protein